MALYRPQQRCTISKRLQFTPHGPFAKCGEELGMDNDLAFPIAIGIALGVGLGATYGNVALGIVVGVLVSVAYTLWRRRAGR
ncbi:hypothetical protein IE4872_PD00878 (plasmid) [Rhizobium gallicum]|uniref:Uncharacterized protein n=1 Tax=Rhizobium gallicum TaxID=56730 RepID=A0A1L5NU29_9HYPH|nr:hypothetical protein IE4872_PD00878 [Rhizobium gallicum]